MIPDQSDQIQDLAGALASAQGEMPNAELDGFNPHFKSKFATLVSTRKATLPSLTKYGLSIAQTHTVIDGENYLKTRLFHKSGQWISGLVKMNPTKNDPQAVIAATSYFKRTDWAAICGIANDEDDDGNAASAKPQVSSPQRHTPTQQMEMPGHNKPHEFRFKFGKYKDKSFDDIGNIEELEGYLTYLKRPDEKKSAEENAESLKKLAPIIDSFQIWKAAKLSTAPKKAPASKSAPATSFDKPPPFADEDIPF